LFIINIYTLVAGFFIYPFYFKASSDAYAITFFVLAVYVTLLLLRDGSRWKYKIILLIACLFCAGMIKYLFIPLAFVIPYFLFSVKTLPDKPYIKKAGIVSFLLLLLLFGGFIAYQKISAGTAGYIASDTRGLFASNLKQSYPYFPASFINPDTLASILNLSNNVIIAPFQHLHFVCLVIAFCYFIYYIFWKGFNNRNLTTAFFLVTALIAFMLTILLAGLSLSIGKEEEMPGVFWTYVQEPRYYGLIIILLQLALAASYKVIRTKKIFYSLFLVASMALLIETGRGLYFSFNRLSKMGKEEYSWQYEKRFQEFAHSVIQQSKGESKLDHVVVTSSHYYWMHRVGLKSHVPLLYEPGSVNELQLLETQKPTILIVILHEDQLQDYKPFLSNPLKKTKGTFDKFHFFSTHIMPYH